MSIRFDSIGADDNLLVADLLIKHGANINAKDIQDDTLLHWTLNDPGKLENITTLSSFTYHSTNYEQL